MLAIVTYLEGPYLRTVEGELAALVPEGGGEPQTLVVSTDGAAHFIPVHLVIKVNGDF